MNVFHIFFSFLILCIASNSFQSDRYFTISFDRQNGGSLSVVFDPLIQDLSLSSFLLCRKIGCLPSNTSQLLTTHVQSIIMEQLNIEESRLIQNYFSRSDHFKFLYYSAMDQRIRFNRTKIEINSLKIGEIPEPDICCINPNDHCHNKTSITNYCRFSNLIGKYFGNKNKILPLSIQDLVILLEDLFNQNLFDHMEAISIYLLSTIFPFHYSVSNSSSQNIVSNEITLSSVYPRNRILMLLSEVYHLKGRILDSNLLSLSLILGNGLSTQGSFLQRLRSIISVPSIPRGIGRDWIWDEGIGWLGSLGEDSVPRHALEHEQAIRNDPPWGKLSPPMSPSFAVSEIPLSHQRRLLLEDLQALLSLSRHPHSHDPQPATEGFQNLSWNLPPSPLIVSLSTLQSDLSTTAFHLSHQGMNDLSFQSLLAELYLSVCPELHYVHPHLLSPSNQDNPQEFNAASVRQTAGDPLRHKYKSIRIGFFSSHFFDHSIGRILAETIIFLSSHGQTQLQINKQILDALHSSLGQEARELLKEIHRPLEVFAYYLDYTLPISTSPCAFSVAPSSPSQATSSSPRLGKHDFITSALSQFLNLQLEFPSPQSDSPLHPPPPGSCFPSNQHFFTFPNNLTVIRDVVGGHKLDVLVFTDIGMDFTSFITSLSRLATFQAAWWGHPITSGSPSIDFFLGLDVEVQHAGETEESLSGSMNTTPGQHRKAQGHYSEQLVRFSLMSSSPLIQVLRESTEAPTPPFIRQLLLTSTYTDEIPSEGVSEDGEGGGGAQVRYALLLGRLFKIHPLFARTLSRLLISLHRDLRCRREESAEAQEDSPLPFCRIVLIAEEQPEWTETALQSLLYHVSNELQLESGGIEGDRSHTGVQEVMKRLRFVPYRRYVPLLSNARLVLDSFPYGGCLTTHDAFATSTPILTLPMEHARGRYTLGMFQQIGVPTEEPNQIEINEHSQSKNLTEEKMDGIKLKYLIAHSPDEYVSKAMHLMLVPFHTWMADFVEPLQRRYPSLHRNREVAYEWAKFFESLMRGESES